MRLTEVAYTNSLPVEGYGTGFFRIGGEVRSAPLAILPSGVVEWRGFDDATALLAAGGAVDFVLIGTGQEIVPIPGPLRTALEQAGLGVEFMTSPQACRTYNVLIGEGRRVALALMPV